jgi:hypothetical protein
MIQTLNRQPTSKAEKILCYYHNNTQHIQIARIENIPYGYFERVFFPGDRLVFEAFPYAWLDLYTGDLCSALLAERILCDHLRVASLLQP